MLDKTKRYLVVGLGLLGGKYALELTRAGFHVDGINRSEGHLQYALEHGYIASGKTHDFEDLVRQADHIIFGLYPTALLDWFRTYGSLRYRWQESLCNIWSLCSLWQGCIPAYPDTGGG